VADDLRYPPPPYRPPAGGGLVWDDRLLPAGRAMELAGAWRWYPTFELSELSQFETEGGGAGQADRWQVNLRCAQCHQSVAELGPGNESVTTGTAELLAGVLRHLVMAHDIALSGAGKAGGNEGS
jgi:hypothetical protein